MADDITLDAPETRIERFLAAAAGVDGITLDEPETRIERYLKSICDRLKSIGERFVVTFTYDDQTETWSADKTFAECVAAWEAGKNLFAKDGEGNYYPLSLYNATDIQFSNIDAETFAVIGGYAIDEGGVYYYGT